MTKADIKKKSITTDSGEEISYEKLIIALGSVVSNGNQRKPVPICCLVLAATFHSSILFGRKTDKEAQASLADSKCGPEEIAAYDSGIYL